MRKRIAIVGAGLNGLSAAYDLLGVGHDVTVYEAGNGAGGLARGFRDALWEWPLEHFYHHVFQSDKDLIHLVDELDIRDKLFFPKPLTSMYYDGQIYPFDSPKAFFDFPGMSFMETVRFGAVSAGLRYTRLWRLLEKVTADKWMRRWYGENVYETVWKPLLINKFGRYYDQVPMSWMWARLYARSFRLGYFEGGFQTFADALTTAVERRHGRIRLRTPVTNVSPLPDGRLAVTDHQDRTEAYDQCLITTSPHLLQQLVPTLAHQHEAYTRQLRDLTSIGAVVMVVALRWPLMKNTYWLNLPARSVHKHENELPYLALVEHTNYIDNQYYGGDHIVYLGDYVPADHEYFFKSKEEMENLFLPTLSKFNPNFQRQWVRKTWLFRAQYAQPVPFVNHSKNIPDRQTPIPGLYFAGMSQVYPWDRGTNFAVRMGRQVAELMRKEQRERPDADSDSAE